MAFEKPPFNDVDDADLNRLATALQEDRPLTDTDFTEKLDRAVADHFAIADLRARSQQTDDTTAPTLNTQDNLQTSPARVQSLVAQLAETTTDEERYQVEGELSRARRKVSRLQTRLDRLERRVSLTPGAVTVQTGGKSGSDDGGSWGFTDAIDDAGKMLAISAGVALALNRAWVRSSHRRALKEN